MRDDATLGERDPALAVRAHDIPEKRRASAPHFYSKGVLPDSSQVNGENCNRILIDLGGKQAYTISHGLAPGRVMARVWGRAAM